MSDFDSGLFEKYVQQPPTLHAVKLTPVNYMKVAEHIVHAVGENVSVTFPRGRGALLVGAERLELGEWIVQEFNSDTFGYNFRPATQEEVRVYGLD